MSTLTVVLLLALLFAVEHFAAGIILRRLETRHPELWAELGAPSAGEATVTEKWRAMGRFIYGGICLRIDDVPLSVLCATVALGELAVLYALFAGIFSQP